MVMIFTRKIKAITEKSGFMRNLSRLLRGTIISQALLVATLPILTRIYSPKAFAEYAVFIAIIGILTPITNGRFEIAIPVARNRVEAIELLKLSLLSNIALATTLFIALYFFGDAILTRFGIHSAKLYAYAIPFCTLLMGIYNALQFWLTREKDFHTISSTRIRQTTISIATQIGLGLSPLQAHGLVFGSTLSFTGGLSRMLRGAPKISLLIRIRVARLTAAYKRYAHYLIYSTPEALVNAAAAQTPVLIVAYYATGPETAFLMIAMKFIKIPMTLVGKSVSQVYISHALEYKSSGTLRRKTIAIMRNLGLIFSLPLIIAAIFFKILIPYILGTEYSRVGDLIAWMTPWAILMIMTSPVAMGLNVLNLQRLGLAVQTYGLLIRTGLTILFGIFMPAYICEAYAVAGALFYGVFMLIILHKIRDKSQSKPE